MQNYQGRGRLSVIGEADNTYRDLDNSAYHKNLIQ